MVFEYGTPDEGDLDVGRPETDQQTGAVTYTVRGYSSQVSMTITPVEGGFEVGAGSLKPQLARPLPSFKTAYTAALQLARFELVVEEAHRESP
jgi:hypothetical protein